ncbi:Ig-like domain-containing protein [uncultured Porphyromonas sp.]|uniref:Ig-like domain-containing protein n=1 Tax=uncultured Porphyromonas sp. TaxID=159274 RepID=UPI0026211D84|nr:Ig-like domain-containing protein [uncultured Porphyromonas sp.]
MRKNLCFTPLLILLSLALGACDSDSCNEPVCIAVAPAELTLEVGEMQTLSVSTGASARGLEVSFTSSAPDIATVDAKGSVTAVQVGSATITVQVGTGTTSVPVTVVANKNDAPQQLPLIKFDVSYDDSGNVSDEDILSYERSLGRESRPIFYTESIVYKGFVNTDLSTITGVIYGLELGDGSKIIVAYGTETISDCPKTREMLRQLGFSHIEERVVGLDVLGKTTPGLYAIHDRDPSLSVLMYDQSNKDIKANMYIQFSRIATVEALHPLIPNVADFPALEIFAKHDVDAIKAFEKRLGFRDFSEDESYEANLCFNTKSDKEDKSNLAWVIYVNESDAGPAFINSEVTGISTLRELTSDGVRNYLSKNGFDRNYSITTGNYIQVYNAQGDLCHLFIQEYEDGNACMMQFICKSDLEEEEQQARRQLPTQFMFQKPLARKGVMRSISRTK